MNSADIIKRYAAANPIPAFAAIGVELAPRNGSNEMFAFCPGHDDRTTPNLRVSLAKGALATCDVCGLGGTIIDVAIKKWDAGSFGDIKDRLLYTLGLNGIAGAPTDGRKILREIAYEIRDLRGELVATHHRRDFDDGKKRMWWPQGTKPHELPLYGIERTVDFPDGAEIVICEGEKAADALWDRGFLAVASVTGAAAIPCDESLKSVTRFRVRLWPDSDDPGRQHMARIAARLVALGADVRIIEWADAPNGGDAADFSGDVQALIDSAREPTIKTDLPEIYLDAPPRTQTRLALEALTAANVPPRLFNQNGIPCRLRPTDADRLASIEVLDADDLLAELVNVVDFFSSQEQPEPVYPPANLIKVIRGRGDLPFPSLERIVRTPFFLPNGELVTRSGYHPGAKVYVELGRELDTLRTVPRRPDEADLIAAKQIIDFPIRQYPFDGRADHAAAIAVEIPDFVRDLIRGPLPAAAVSAPLPRTGKGKLVKTLCAPGLGRMVAAAPELPRSEDEARKFLTSVLMKGDPFLFLDNISRIVKGGVLAAFLTADAWQDRLLGGNRLTDIPIRLQAIIAGNVLTYSLELRRRTLPIYLDARVPHPDRRKFTEPLNPEGYALEHRSELVWAILTLIQNYEDDLETERWRPFFEEWWSRHSDKAVLPATILPLTSELLASKPDESERARATRLGMLLSRKLGVCYDLEIDNDWGRRIRTLQLIRKPYDRGEGRKSLGWALSDITAPPEFKRADLETDLAALPAADDTGGKPSPDEGVVNHEPPTIDTEMSPSAPADEGGEPFSESGRPERREEF